MLTKHMKLAMILTAAMSTSALAQTATEVETPDGQTVVVPGAAVESDGVSPIATVVESDYPVFNQDANDEAIAETLIAQGFSDIYILRDGSLMTVTATRDGDDIKLVYNLVEGRLIEVNGERVLTEEERTLDPSPDAEQPTATEEAPTEPAEEATEEGATDEATDGATDGATDEGATDGATDDGATDAPDADTGTDASTDTGTDSGTDDATDSGTDSGADSGADSGSDSGSDGGSDGTGGSDSDGTNG